MSEEEQYQILLRILNEGRLKHGPVMEGDAGSGTLLVNLSAKPSDNEACVPGIVCFCDIPTEDLANHTSKFSKFGLSLSKNFIVAIGGVPILYLPRAAKAERAYRTKARSSEEARQMYGPDGDLQEVRKMDKPEELFYGQLFDDIFHEYHSLLSEVERELDRLKGFMHRPDFRIRDLTSFLDRRIFSYIKFFDHTLPDDHPDNYYMEREWRVVGYVDFELKDVLRIIVPSEFGERLRKDVPDYSGQISFT